MKKFLIIPVDDIAMEINAKDKEEALIEFAMKMDLDMHQYFRAVTEDEYELIKMERNIEGSHEQFIDYATDVALDDFYVDDLEAAGVIAERAWDIWSDGETPSQYECIERAVREYEEEQEEDENDDY